MIELLRQFLTWLSEERDFSSNAITAYGRDLRRFLVFLIETDRRGVGGLSARDISAFLVYLRRSGSSPRSMARNLSALRTFYLFLKVEYGLMDDPTDGVKAPRDWKRIPPSLRHQDIERLLSAPNVSLPLGVRDKAILEFMYATGMRVSEVISFRLEDLDFQSRMAYCFGKRRRARAVPVGNAALEWLEIYCDSIRAQVVGSSGERVLFLNWRGHPLSRMGLWKIVTKYASAVGLKGKITPHTLRHACATHLLEGGANLREVQEMMGHRSLRTTLIYTKLDMEYLKEEVRRFHPRG